MRSLFNGWEIVAKRGKSSKVRSCTKNDLSTIVICEARNITEAVDFFLAFRRVPFLLNSTYYIISKCLKKYKLCMFCYSTAESKCYDNIVA